MAVKFFRIRGAKTIAAPLIASGRLVNVCDLRPVSSPRASSLQMQKSTLPDDRDLIPGTPPGTPWNAYKIVGSRVLSARTKTRLFRQGQGRRQF